MDLGGEAPERPPAGSLQFRNRDDVPHEIAVEVLDVGRSVGDRVNGHFTVAGTPRVGVATRDLTATAVLEPGESRTYESVFESPVWYDVRFTVDDEYPGEDLGRTVFNPSRPDDTSTGHFLVGDVSTSGEVSWQISTTEDLGAFE